MASGCRPNLSSGDWMNRLENTFQRCGKVVFEDYEGVSEDRIFQIITYGDKLGTLSEDPILYIEGERIGKVRKTSGIQYEDFYTDLLSQGDYSHFSDFVRGEGYPRMQLVLPSSSGEDSEGEDDGRNVVRDPEQPKPDTDKSIIQKIKENPMKVVATAGVLLLAWRSSK